VNYQSFESFTAAAKSARAVHARHGGIYHQGRRFWSMKLQRWVGKRGKIVRYFLDPTGAWGEEAIVFTADGEYLCSAYEVGRRRP